MARQLVMGRDIADGIGGVFKLTPDIDLVMKVGGTLTSSTGRKRAKDHHITLTTGELVVIREREVWLTIRDKRVASGKYQISSLGRVRNLDTIRVMTTFRSSDGYRRITLRDRGTGKSNFQVHRLVCNAFHGAPPSPLHVHVCHADGDNTNNRADNLRHDTIEENARDKRLVGTNSRAGIVEKDVVNIRNKALLGHTYAQIAEEYNVTRSAIGQIVRNEVWKDTAGPVRGRDY